MFSRHFAFPTTQFRCVLSFSSPGSVSVQSFATIAPELGPPQYVFKFVYWDSVFKFELRGFCLHSLFPEVDHCKSEGIFCHKMEGFCSSNRPAPPLRSPPPPVPPAAHCVAPQRASWSANTPAHPPRPASTPPPVRSNKSKICSAAET
jgi:hypothetical protein